MTERTRAHLAEAERLLRVLPKEALIREELEQFIANAKKQFEAKQ